MYPAIVLGSAALTVVLLLVLLRGRPRARRGIVKTLAVLFFTVAFLRFFLSDIFVYVINGAWHTTGDYIQVTDVLQVVLRWGHFASYAVLPMAAFTESRFFRNVAIFLSLPFAVANAIAFEDTMAYFIAPIPDGFQHGIVTPPTFRYVFYAVELVLAVVIPFLILIGECHVFHAKRLREWRDLLLGIPGILLSTMPVYVPQALFGHDVHTPGKFSVYHLIWLVALLAVTLTLYYLFRFRDYKSRYYLCVFLTLALFFHYDSMYLMGITLKRLPLQLCNVAAYFYMIAILLKSNRMFQFCFLANMVGTLFAILLPDFSPGNMNFWNVHFITQHSFVLIIPAMAMGLRIFPRLKLRSLLYYFIGFTAYFLFVFVLGTIINAYPEVFRESVNYFYMFDLDMAFSYFPFLTFTEKFCFSFGRFTVYPVVVSIVYFGFVLLTFLFYLLVKLFYRLEDDHLALRLAGIELREELTKKPSRRPKHFID